jgi:uncharacterized protein (TIGR02453 family)
MGAGCWHPDRDALERIRDAIVEDPDAWFAARDAVLAAGLQLAGDSLKRNPRGYPPEHPAVDDLKRKDFIAVRPMSEKEALDPVFISTFARACGDAAPLMRFLTSALGVPF